MNTSSDILVFDRQKVRQNRKRCFPHLDKHGFLFDWTLQQIEERLDVVTRHFPVALQIGCRPQKQLLKTHGIETFFTSEIIDTKNKSLDLIADEEFLPYAPHSFDLIVNPLNLHSVNDLPGTLIQIKQALKPDGLFIGALLGGETLHELRDVFMQAESDILGGASPRIAPFADKQQMGNLMQRAGFSLPVIDSEFVRVSYDNLFKLFHDLRYMGEGNTLIDRSIKPLPKEFFMRSAELYAERYHNEEGRLETTFEVIFITGWAPHQEQQKPLRPGSAKHSLAEALNTNEIKAGEKALP